MEQIRKIIVAGLIGYERRLRESKRTGKPLHMGAKDSKKGRWRKKLLDKSTWFKKRRKEGEDEKELEEELRKCKKGRGWKDKKMDKEGKKFEDRKEEVRTTSVMFVEKTVGGELAKRLREKGTS